MPFYEYTRQEANEAILLREMETEHNFHLNSLLRE